MLRSLHLSNFRGFSQVRLNNLQRVNLIVGRNNSGKTSLLEAIAFLQWPSEPQHMPKLLRPQFGNVRDRYFRWLVRDGSETADASIKASVNGHARDVVFWRGARDHVTQQQIQLSHQSVYNDQRMQIFVAKNISPLKCRVVSVEPKLPNELVSLFATAVKRAQGEEQIETMLREVDERIRKIRVYPSDDGIQIVVDLGLSEMLPVTQIGQGINRLIAMFSELIGESPNICIIDEIENGIHHSLLAQVWAGIAVAADKLNVQVFATTHSYESIEAADAAFSKCASYDFSIIQLFRVESGDQARLLDREHIQAALKGGIDLR